MLKRRKNIWTRQGSNPGPAAPQAATKLPSLIESLPDGVVFVDVEIEDVDFSVDCHGSEDGAGAD